MSIRIEPYKRWSGGAKALGNRCGILRATPKQVNKHTDFTHIINWGNSERRFNGQYINNPENVSLASNKEAAFQRFKEAGVPIPDCTTDKTVAVGWLQAGHGVVARTLLRASGGRGIKLVVPNGGGGADDKLLLPDAPLYTIYVKKAEEYRVHVVRGEILDVQQKRKRQEVPNDEVNYQIRNASNGWVYCRGGVTAPDCVRVAARAAVSALGLDFGAVDVGYNKHEGSACVYEVNTAPGLEGTTLERYYTAFLKLFPQLKGGMYLRRRQHGGYDV